MSANCTLFSSGYSVHLHFHLAATLIITEGNTWSPAATMGRGGWENRMWKISNWDVWQSFHRFDWHTKTLPSESEPARGFGMIRQCVNEFKVSNRSLILRLIPAVCLQVSMLSKDWVCLKQSCACTQLQSYDKEKGLIGEASCPSIPAPFWFLLHLYANKMIKLWCNPLLSLAL